MRKVHDAENNEKIRAVWSRLETQVLDYVVNLMRANAFVDHTDEINSPYALVLAVTQKGVNLGACRWA